MVENKQNNNSLFHKIVQKKTLTGRYAGQTLFDISRWKIGDLEGLNLFIMVDKPEYKDSKNPDKNKEAKKSFTTIDISDKEIQKVLIEAVEIAQKHK